MNTSSGPDHPLRVAQLVSRLGERIQSTDDFKDLWIEGEVSGARAYPSGIVYFTLRESNVALDGVISARHAAQLALMPRDGLKILVHANVELNFTNGRCQLRVDEVRPAGAGEAYLRREALKRRLAAEGLFKEERKRPLPPAPRRIGVVTSRSGAVWHDIQVVVARRDPTVELIFAASQVQGGAAPDALIAALDGLALVSDLDCVILARGGGAAEDLSAFDDEALARRIARMPVPVCVGVGHETDVTIADLVADRRAATPSNAAELVVPDRSGALERAAVLRRQIVARALAHVRLRRQRGEAAKRLLDRRSPRALLDARRQRLDEAFGRVNRRGPGARALAIRQEAVGAVRRIERTVAGALRQRRGRLEASRRLLEAMSPLGVLGRGYALVEGADGHIRTESAMLAPGERARLRMRDGRVQITIDEVRRG